MFVLSVRAAEAERVLLSAADFGTGACPPPTSVSTLGASRLPGFEPFPGTPGVWRRCGPETSPAWGISDPPRVPSRSPRPGANALLCWALTLPPPGAAVTGSKGVRSCSAPGSQSGAGRGRGGAFSSRPKKGEELAWTAREGCVTGLVNPPYPYLTPSHLFPLDSIGVRSGQKRPPRPRCLLRGSPFGPAGIQL